MKYRAKQNEVNKNCRCLSVGYCDLQNELSILDRMPIRQGFTDGTLTFTNCLTIM